RGVGPGGAVRIAVELSGDVEVVTGGSALGQGFETVMAQICADALNVDYRRVRVVHGQTSRIAQGIGAHATRATVMTGSATHNAATKLRALVLKEPAPLLQPPVDALTVVKGLVQRKDKPEGPSLALGELARRLEGRLTAEGEFVTAHMTYPYGVHAAVVAIDRATGRINVERYAIAYD